MPTTEQRIQYLESLHPANQPPIVVAGGPYAAEEGEPIQFSSVGTNDPEGHQISYLWDFGGGITSTEANPELAFATEGNYDITLTVTDEFGQVGIATTTVTVTP